jgi:hypothetical protein
MYSSLLSLIDGNSFSIIQKNGIFVNIINYCIYYDLLYQNNLNMCYIFKIENEIIGYCYLDVICGKILTFEIFKPFQRKKFGLLFFNMLKKRYTNFDKFELIPTSESISFWRYISKKTSGIIVKHA